MRDNPTQSEFLIFLAKEGNFILESRHIGSAFIIKIPFR
jgi:hypothetical protein